MGNCDHDHFVPASVVDDTIGITGKRTVLAAGIGLRKTFGIRSDLFDGCIDFGREANGCAGASIGVPIEGFVEF